MPAPPGRSRARPPHPAQQRIAPEPYDVIVIGGGAAGENAAGYARDNRLSVALVERELVGGECSYWACMPSKALLRPGEVLAAARRVPGAAPAVTGTVEGADGPRTLQASTAVVLATGTSPAVPPIEGLADISFWDSRGATAARVVPERLVVLGGGAVGVELAQAFRRLGTREVTVVQRNARLLPREEPPAGDLLRTALEAEGITVLTGATTVRASRDGAEGAVTLTLDDGRRLHADELLVATGRRPNTTDLGVESVGLEPGRAVDVDDRLRATGVAGAWLYAVGDVNGRALLTHQGKYQARIAADVIAGRDVGAWADQRAVPRVVFTDPEVAAVGLTEAQARAAGIAVGVRSVPFGSVAATALHGRDLDGVALLVIDESRRTIVGVTFVGPAAGGLLHAATIAVVSGITLDQLWHAVPAFPTLSELWLRLLEADRGL